MSLMRAMMVWVLALCLPVQGMAASLMTHCKDMQKIDAAASVQDMGGMNHHDHAAMMQMAAMPDASVMPPSHALTAHETKSTENSGDTGCQCGCECSGNCALSCAGMMLGLGEPAPRPFASSLAIILISAPCGQAHTAYCNDPLRPPSAVAL